MCLHLLSLFTVIPVAPWVLVVGALIAVARASMASNLVRILPADGKLCTHVLHHRTGVTV
jgi:hypothetical protein